MRRIWIVFLILAMVLVACDSTSGNATVVDAWVRAANSGNSAAYMTITNDGNADITLVRVEADFAANVQVHQTVVENDVARMMHMEDGVVIPAGGNVELAPGGYHVMFMDLEAPLTEGEEANFTLYFDNGSSVEITAPIRVGEGMSGMSMGDATEEAMDMTEEATEEPTEEPMTTEEPAMDMTEEATDDSAAIVIEGTWVRAADSGNSAAYMSITNNGTEDVTLIDAEADFAEAVEVHQTVIDGDVARMLHIADGLLIPVGETVELVPGSYHVMFISLTAELTDGEIATFTLHFDDDSSIDIEAPIQIGAGMGGMVHNMDTEATEEPAMDMTEEAMETEAASD